LTVIDLAPPDEQESAATGEKLAGIADYSSDSEPEEAKVVTSDTDMKDVNDSENPFPEPKRHDRARRCQ
jgi:hypothetical protein